MSQNIKRYLSIQLPAGQSAFLWGPRKTGKTTFLREGFSNSLVFDFLDTDLFIEFSKKPALFRQQILAQPAEKLKYPIILDEVQKVPAILDEVHWLIENKKLTFILCGSSARKLKRGHANLLGGRAWRYEMFPLAWPELAEKKILRILNNGLIPAHFIQDDPRRSLKAYVIDYLKEEVFDEGLIRNIPAFSRFFEAMGYSHGEITNFSNIARDCGVDSKTVREYYNILVDTLLGNFVEPFSRKNDRNLISKMPKFYLFDVGVANYMAKRTVLSEKGEGFGKAFEHYIYMELAAYRGYANKDFPINYWRTKTGLEVDFILNGELAVEVKSNRIDSKDLLAIKTFKAEYNPKKAFVISNEKIKRNVEDILIIPWQQFLTELWAGKIL